MTGATETGKSHLARALFLAAATPRTVIDPADSDLTRVPGARTFRDPRSRVLLEAPTSRFVPTDSGDLDAYDELYRRMFNAGPRYVWVDEAGIVFPQSNRANPRRNFLVQGRKRELGHLALHTRPRECDVNLIAQAMHVAAFQLPNPDDRDRIAELAGIPPRQLDAEMRRLEPHGFLWWSVRGRTLTVCDPLPR